MVSGMGVGVSDLVDRAREFATAFHASIGQRRKYTDEPYNRLRRKAVRSVLNWIATLNGGQNGNQG